VQRFAALTATDAPLALTLRSGLPNAESEDIADAFRAALAAGFARDVARGMTTVGPHRADLVLWLGGREARAYASQGQQRSMVLALKLAELDAVRSRARDEPILLLDDVSSELDAERTARLFAQLTDKAGQVWVTTTGATTLPLPKGAHVLVVEAGHVRASVAES
ncbi:MAG: hypothetical protein HYZ27_10095, partial [Deltaproteobacteria bacterium]|nr:hypothetical protein [Deltaproteobacteria bacterium]